MGITLQDVLIESLSELHAVEREQVRVLQQMSEEAAAPELQKMFQEHSNVTAKQAQRLEKIFQTLGVRPGENLPEGFRGLLADQQRKCGRDADNEIIDLALADAARQVEHFEIACYHAAQDMSQAAGMPDAARLLGESLAEEEAAAKRLSQAAGPILGRAAEMEESEVEAEVEREESKPRTRKSGGGG